MHTLVWQDQQGALVSNSHATAGHLHRQGSSQHATRHIITRTNIAVQYIGRSSFDKSRLTFNAAAMATSPDSSLSPTASVSTGISQTQIISFSHVTITEHAALCKHHLSWPGRHEATRVLPDVPGSPQPNQNQMSILTFAKHL